MFMSTLIGPLCRLLVFQSYSLSGGLCNSYRADDDDPWGYQAYYGPRVAMPPYYNSAMAASGHPPPPPYMWNPQVLLLSVNSKDFFFSYIWKTID